VIINYCTILFNLTHPCDCDTLDQFDTSTQMAGDCDRAKISTLDKAQIGSFEGFVLSRGVAEGRKSQNIQNMQ